MDYDIEIIIFMWEIYVHISIISVIRYNLFLFGNRYITCEQMAEYKSDDN